MVRVALRQMVRRSLSVVMAILNTATKRTKGESKDAEEHDGDNHRDHPGNILSGSSHDEPCGGQR
jgi:hypothetical protein